MTLKSALEDLLATTLAAVSGIVGKLEYLSSLRNPKEGAYSHWGLARVYGDGPAQQALAEAHSLLFLRVLRTSLRTLRGDVEVSSEASHTPPAEYVENLRNHLPVLLPQDLGGGSARHFSSVLHALLSLVKSRPDANPPA
ncbi:MAG TPA: hypothetical protein VMT28_13510 [Terriglobales bacterium]|jgi:hypothetical protein|nr:hypothetical protein [Terriglobales bacterium]